MVTLESKASAAGPKRKASREHRQQQLIFVGQLYLRLADPER